MDDDIKHFVSNNWFYTAGLIIPLLAVITIPIFWQLPKFFNIPYFESMEVAQPITALMIGAVITLVCYFAMKYIIIEKHPLAQSVLLGLLAAEYMIFAGGRFPSVSAITLFLFFYYHSVEHPASTGEHFI